MATIKVTGTVEQVELVEREHDPRDYRYGEHTEHKRMVLNIKLVAYDGKVYYFDTPCVKWNIACAPGSGFAVTHVAYTNFKDSPWIGEVDATTDKVTGPRPVSLINVGDTLTINGRVKKETPRYTSLNYVKLIERVAVEVAPTVEATPAPEPVAQEPAIPRKKGLLLAESGNITVEQLDHVTIVVNRGGNVVKRFSGSVQGCEAAFQYMHELAAEAQEPVPVEAEAPADSFVVTPPSEEDAWHPCTCGASREGYQGEGPHHGLACPMYSNEVSDQLDRMFAREACPRMGRQYWEMWERDCEDYAHNPYRG